MKGKPKKNMKNNEKKAVAKEQEIKQKVKKQPSVKMKKVLLACVAVLILVGIGFGTFFVIDYILVDTPYDSVSLPKHIQVAKYMGAELSESQINSEYDNAKTELLKALASKEAITSGKIEEGQNVTIMIAAYDYTGGMVGQQISSISVSEKEITSVKKYDLNDLPEGEEIFFPEIQNRLIGVDFNFTSEYYNNMAPDLIYTYPADYNITEVKGKTVLHRVYIKSVTKSVYPEWNDAMIASNSDAIDEFLGLKLGLTTVKEYDDYMRQTIRINLLWNNIVNASKVVEYPENMINKYSEEFDDYYNTLMKQNEMTFDELLKELQTNETGYIQTRLEYAQGIVKEEMVLYEIIQAEKIRLSGDEYEEGLLTLAAENGSTPEAFEESYGKALAKRTVLWEKVKVYLSDNCTIVP